MIHFRKGKKACYSFIKLKKTSNLEFWFYLLGFLIESKMNNQKKYKYNGLKQNNDSCRSNKLTRIHGMSDRYRKRSSHIILVEEKSKSSCIKLNPILFVLIFVCLLIIFLVLFLLIDFLRTTALPILVNNKKFKDDKKFNLTIKNDGNQTLNSSVSLIEKITGSLPSKIEKQKKPGVKPKKTHTLFDLSDSTLDKIECKIYQVDDQGCGPHGQCFYINDEDVYLRECFCDKVKSFYLR